MKAILVQSDESRIRDELKKVDKSLKWKFCDKIGDGLYDSRGLNCFESTI